MIISSLLCLLIQETKGLVLEDALKTTGQSGKHIAENGHVESEIDRERTDGDDFIKDIKYLTDNGGVHQNGKFAKFGIES